MYKRQAYSRTNADTDSSSILVFSFAEGKIYRVTQEYESALLLGVSDDYVVWMDVTSRERDIVKFTKIPLSLIHIFYNDAWMRIISK